MQKNAINKHLIWQRPQCPLEIYGGSNAFWHCMNTTILLDLGQKWTDSDNSRKNRRKVDTNGKKWMKSDKSGLWVQTFQIAGKLLVRIESLKPSGREFVLLVYEPTYSKGFHSPWALSLRLIFALLPSHVPSHCTPPALALLRVSLQLCCLTWGVWRLNILWQILV